MDMVEAFSSREELIWIQNGFKPPRNLVPTGADNSGVPKRHLMQIVDVLCELRLPYMVIGAFALPARGRPRATLDHGLHPSNNGAAGKFCQEAERSRLPLR